MKKNNNIARYLREEILQAQKRRHEYCLKKLSFVIGFLGIGSLSGISDVTSFNINSRLFLFLVPIISVIFDLYIMGEDFGIKRIGNFLKNNKNIDKTIIEWEEFVHKNPNRLPVQTFWLTTIIVTVISLSILYFMYQENILNLLIYFLIIIVSLLIVSYYNYLGSKL